MDRGPPSAGSLPKRLQHRGRSPSKAGALLLVWVSQAADAELLGLLGSPSTVCAGLEQLDQKWSSQNANQCL